MTVYGFRDLIARAAEKAIPLDVQIELTSHCNFRCVHCYIPDFHAPDLLSTDRILRLLEELVEMGTLFLTLTGGELFLRRDWFVIARRARELGFSLRLFTNASLIDDTVADQIRTLNAVVEVSLYSMRPEVFERITQRPGSFARTLQGIERLRARGVDVVLKIPLMRYNYRDLREVIAYAQRIGASYQAFHKIVHRKNGDPHPIALRVPHVQMVPLFGGPYTGCTHPTTNSRDPRWDGPLCAAGTRYCHITAQGDVLACNILPVPAGNIREKSFREIWERSPWLQKIRSIRRKDLTVCGSCEKLFYCGRCHAQALIEEGDLLAPTAWSCEQAAIADALNAERNGVTGEIGPDHRCRRCGAPDWYVHPDGIRRCWTCSPPECEVCHRKIRKSRSVVRWHRGRPSFCHDTCG